VKDDLTNAQGSESVDTADEVDEMNLGCHWCKWH